MSLDPKVKDVPERERGPATATEALAMRESDPLPPFLSEQVRHREAYLQLIKDLNVTLAQEWSSQPEVKIREKISAAIADSLRIWI